MEDQIRTLEQIEADNKLTEAVDACMRAYGIEGAVVLGDFVVLTSIQTISEDNVLITGYPMFVRDGDIPWYRILGLINTHRLMVEKQMNENLGSG